MDGGQGKPGAARRPLNYMSLFSGMEAATAAIRRLQLGWKPVAFADVNPFSMALLRHKWPRVRNLADVTRAPWKTLPEVDILVGGSPCQDFSIAGKQEGIDGKNGRLTRDYLDAVRILQPEWVLWENVDFVLRSNEGRDFSAFINGLVDCGYCAAWRVLDAQHFGLPARRARCFVVGYRGTAWGIPAEILDIADGRRRYLEATGGEGRAEGEEEGDPSDPADSPGRYRLPRLTKWRRRPRRMSHGRHAGPLFHADTHNGAVSATQTQCLRADFDGAGSHQGCWIEPLAVDFRNGGVGTVAGTLQKGGQGVSLNVMPGLLVDQDLTLRRVSVLEALRLQGFDDDWLDDITYKDKPLSDTQCYKLIGNSWAVPCAAWVLERINAMDKLLAERGDIELRPGPTWQDRNPGSVLLQRWTNLERLMQEEVEPEPLPYELEEEEPDYRPPGYYDGNDYDDEDYLNDEEPEG